MTEGGPASTREEQLSEAWLALSAEAAAILARHNPIGVRELPADEYEPEASGILPRLIRAGSGDEARAIVVDVFTSMLGPEYTVGLESAADELWAAVERSGLRAAATGR